MGSALSEAPANMRFAGAQKNEFCRRPKTHFATSFQAAGSVDGSYCPEEALGSALSEVPANMRFAGAQKRILQLAFKQLDLLMVPTALRKLWAVRCPRRLQTCVLQAPKNAFCNLLSSSWIC